MRSFAHVNVSTVDAALAALHKYGKSARLIAGGTDLLGGMKDEIFDDYPGTLINIKGIADLDYVREEKDRLRVGALTRLSEIARLPLLCGNYRAIAEAAHSVASPQIRNAATVGGNLCQDVRCWYYRYPRHIGGPMRCLRKGKGPCFAVRGDNRYHAVMGGKKCFAVCPSDLATALAALDAVAVIATPAGERRVAVADFYTPLGNRLKANELLREIEIPRAPGPNRQTFLKFTLRRPIDFAIVSVASMLAMEGGTCTDARISLGAMASGPVRAKEAEELLKGQRIGEALAEKAAATAVQGAKPLSKNAYKVEIAKILVKRAILTAGS